MMVAVVVSVLTFALVHLSGDLATALAGPNATPADIDAIRTSYGLDRSLPVQFFEWAGRALRGDLGESYFFREPVAEMIASRLPVTLTVGLFALGIAVCIGVPAGILAGLRPNSTVDRLVLFVSMLGQAIPTFWLALILIIVFGVQLRWLPISGTESWQHYVLPSVTVGLYAMPAFMRLTRTGMIEVLEADYIRTARAKGLRSRSIVLKHALRNAMIPVVAVAPVQLGFMLGGSVVVESVFAINGLGFLSWQSISRADFPVIQAVVLVLSVIYVALTLLAELLSAVLDPRLRTN